MVVGIKDSLKLVIISVMSCCAVLVCAMFLNFNIDLTAIEGQIQNVEAAVYYNALKMTGIVSSAVSGGCLFLTSVIMLVFYIKHYIDTHKKELGILKAIGYSNFRIAKSFWVFGSSVFVGTGIGFAGSFILMPTFYELQNEDKILPEITMNFHPVLLVCLVIIPSILFAGISVFYASIKLKTPVLSLIRDSVQTAKYSIVKEHKKECSFIDYLKRNTLLSRKSLVFFIIFASFCFSAMTQMSFSMSDMASPMMAAMMLIIGLVLAFVTMFLAVTTVVNGNTKTIAMMKVFGYSYRACCKALLGGYRLMSYIGFAAGTVYQYVLLKIMVEIVLKDIEGVPEYKFDFPAMLMFLAIFIIVYETFMFLSQRRIKNVSVKKIMMEQQ